MTEGKDSDYEKFLRAAGTDLDETTIILRSHLLAEYYLDHFLLESLARGDLITDSRITFSTKLQVVEALDILPRAFVDSVRNLNVVRNRCAHSLDYKVTESDIDKIGRPFGKDYREMKREHEHNNKELLHWTMGMIFAKTSGRLRGITSAASEE